MTIGDMIDIKPLRCCPSGRGRLVQLPEDTDGYLYGVEVEVDEGRLVTIWLKEHCVNWKGLGD